MTLKMLCPSVVFWSQIGEIRGALSKVMRFCEGGSGHVWLHPCLWIEFQQMSLRKWLWDDLWALSWKQSFSPGIVPHGCWLLLPICGHNSEPRPCFACRIVSTTALSFSGERSCENPSWTDLSSARSVASVHLFYVSEDACDASRGVLFHVDPCPPTSLWTNRSNVFSSWSPAHKEAASLSMKQFRLLKRRPPVFVTRLPFFLPRK